MLIPLAPHNWLNGKGEKRMAQKWKIGKNGKTARGADDKNGKILTPNGP